MMKSIWTLTWIALTMMSLDVKAAGAYPGTITKVEYALGTCSVTVEGEKEPRRLAMNSEDCSALTVLIGADVDSITDKEF